MTEDDGWAGFLRSCEAPPAVESAGTLTPETMSRLFDEMWNTGPRLPLPCSDGCACCQPPL